VYLLFQSDYTNTVLKDSESKLNDQAMNPIHVIDSSVGNLNNQERKYVIYFVQLFKE